MTMETEQIENVWVITMPERLDAAHISQIETTFAESVRSHTGNILVDMSKVQFIASLALRLLLTNLKETQKEGGDLRLCGLQPQIAEVFRKSRFDSLFVITSSRETGLERYAK
jgi:anti-sigma B factor antagonist